MYIMAKYLKEDVFTRTASCILDTVRSKSREDLRYEIIDLFLTNVLEIQGDTSKLGNEQKEKHCACY